MHNLNAFTPQEGAITFSADPALHGIGAGVWQDRTLIWGGYIPRPKSAPRRGPEAWRRIALAVAGEFRGLRPHYVVVEQMQVYKDADTDPADLLELAGVGGALAALATVQAFGYLPRTWKGQVPPEVLSARLQGHLAKKDWSRRVQFTGTQRDQDILHGIGVGWFHFGL